LNQDFGQQGIFTLHGVHFCCQARYTSHGMHQLWMVAVSGVEQGKPRFDKSDVQNMALCPFISQLPDWHSNKAFRTEIEPENGCEA